MAYSSGKEDRLEPSRVPKGGRMLFADLARNIYAQSITLPLSGGGAVVVNRIGLLRRPEREKHPRAWKQQPRWRSVVAFQSYCRMPNWVN